MGFIIIIIVMTSTSPWGRPTLLSGKSWWQAAVPRRVSSPSLPNTAQLLLTEWLLWHPLKGYPRFNRISSLFYAIMISTGWFNYLIFWWFHTNRRMRRSEKWENRNICYNCYILMEPTGRSVRTHILEHHVVFSLLTAKKTCLCIINRGD